MPENPNKDYWINRAEATIISGEKSILEYELELKKAYESASAQIEKEIRAFYSKYAKDNKISLSEARRRLKPSEKKSFNAQAKVYLDEIAKMGSTPMTKEYISHLKRLSAKAYMSRLDELNNNIRYNIEKLYAGQSASLGKALNEGYEDSYYRTMFNAQDQAKLGISFTTPGKRTVEAAVKEKWLGQNYSDRIWVNKDKLVKQLEQILPQEFVRSKGPASVARTLSQKLDVSYNNAKRLARTEMNYISNKAAMQAYIDNGIGEYEYVATLDARTSDICRELDGKTFSVKEATTGVNWPPLHPNCRSTTIPYFEDDDIGKVADDRVARAKDGKGKSIKLGQDVSFFEWVEEYGSPEFKARVKAQRHKFLNVDMPPKATTPAAPPKATKNQTVNGTDISMTWRRRADKFDFEIDDIVDAQGFNGLSNVVSPDEFEEAVKKSNFIAQRIYSAPDQDTLDSYRDQLYNGKWYIDCSIGGSAYGRGMYGSYNLGTEVTEQMRKDMITYGAASKFAYVETFTLSEDAKIITSSELTKLSKEFSSKVMDEFKKRGGWTNTNEDAIEWADERLSLRNDYGAFAASLGYDAILVDNGIDNYCVILNRTKVIFKKGGDKI